MLFECAGICFFLKLESVAATAAFIVKHFSFSALFSQNFFEHFERLIEKSFFDHFCGMPQRRHPNVINKRFKEKGYFFFAGGP